jgi:hypothetical protein
MKRFEAQFLGVELYFDDLEKAKEFYVGTMGLANLRGLCCTIPKGTTYSCFRERIEVLHLSLGHTAKKFTSLAPPVLLHTVHFSIRLQGGFPYARPRTERI